MMEAQMRWIRDHKDSDNIQLVIGEGDIVNGWGEIKQWQSADAAYKILDQTGIPYFAALGNHDMAYDGGVRSHAQNFNKFFGPSRYAGKKWYKGQYPQGSNENFYGEVTLGGQPYVVIALEFYPREAAVRWAQNILRSNPEKKAIIVTHSYEHFSGEQGANYRAGKCLPQNAEKYQLGDDMDGEEMWESFRGFKNVWLILSGHLVRGAGQDAVGRRTDLGDDGNLVNEVLANYQNLKDGGDGYMRIMRFHPQQGSVDVSTYSPSLNRSMDDGGNKFSLPLKTSELHGNSATIYGEVKDESTCHNLAGAKVSWSGGSVTTDQNGKYRISNIKEPEINISVSQNGYANQTERVRLAPGLTEGVRFVLRNTSTSPPK
jgi:hypothetical protein